MVIPMGVHELAPGLIVHALIAPGVHTDVDLLYRIPPAPVSVGVSCRADGIDVDGCS